MGFGGDSDVIILLGETRDELGGSEWAWVTHGHLGGQPPRVNLVRERILAAVLTSAADHGHLSSAHDLSDGGLAQALVEACLRYNIGATMALPDDSDPFVMLFAESTARALVSVPRGHERAFIALCADHGLPYTPLGVVDGRSHALDIRDLFRISLDEMRVAWSATMPTLFSDAIPEVLGEPGPSASSESSDSAESPDSASAESESPESPEASDSPAPESPAPESLSTVSPEPSSPESPLPSESSASPTFFEHVEPPEVAEVAEVIESATGSSDATDSSDGAAADPAASARTVRTRLPRRPMVRTCLPRPLTTRMRSPQRPTVRARLPRRPMVRTRTGGQRRTLTSRRPPTPDARWARTSSASRAPVPGSTGGRPEPLS